MRIAILKPNLQKDTEYGNDPSICMIPSEVGASAADMIDDAIMDGDATYIETRMGDLYDQSWFSMTSLVLPENAVITGVTAITWARQTDAGDTFDIGINIMVLQNGVPNIGYSMGMPTFSGGDAWARVSASMETHPAGMAWTPANLAECWFGLEPWNYSGLGVLRVSQFYLEVHYEVPEAVNPPPAGGTAVIDRLEPNGVYRENFAPLWCVTVPSGMDSWDAINPSSYDLTDYVEFGPSTGFETWLMNQPTVLQPTSTINAVELCFYAGYLDVEFGSPTQITPQIGDGTTDVNMHTYLDPLVPNDSIVADFQEYAHIWYKNPRTNQDWTYQDVCNMAFNLYVEPLDGFTKTQVTAAWMNVYYDGIVTPEVRKLTRIESPIGRGLGRRMRI